MFVQNALARFAVQVQFWGHRSSSGVMEGGPLHNTEYLDGRNLLRFQTRFRFTTDQKKNVSFLLGGMLEEIHPRKLT